MRALACLVSAVALVAGCGDDGEPDVRGDQPVPDATQFEPGKFDELPVHPRMQALGPPQFLGPVTVRSYEVRLLTPRQALDEYGALLDDWATIVAPRPVGPDAFQGVWEQDAWALVVTTGPVETTADDGDAQAAAQLSLELYEPGTPPSTAAPLDS